jgi:transposase-like protein
VDEIPLKIPKLREGSYFPSLLEPRRRAEQALLAVIQQAGMTSDTATHCAIE